MAYTPVPTVNSGDLWTAANHNTYIKDNFAAGVPDLFTTKGDLAVGTGADAATRLAAGANGTVLEAASGEASGLIWRAYQFAQYGVASWQHTSSGSEVIVDYATAITSNANVTTGASWKYTAPLAGVYLVNATLLFPSTGWNAGEQLRLRLFKNNAYALYGQMYTYAGATGETPFVQLNAMILLAANDYIDVRCLQSCGATAQTTSTVEDNHIAIARIR